MLCYGGQFTYQCSWVKSTSLNSARFWLLPHMNQMWGITKVVNQTVSCLCHHREWTVPQWSVMIIYNGKWSNFNPMDWASWCQVTIWPSKFIRKQCQFWFVINLITQTKAKYTKGRRWVLQNCAFKGTQWWTLVELCHEIITVTAIHVVRPCCTDLFS